MNARRLTARSKACFATTVAWGLVMAALTAVVRGEPVEGERNHWPVLVRQLDAQRQTESWTGAGPLLFDHPRPEGGRVSGFRPFWFQERNADGDLRGGYFLYPIFSYMADEHTCRWSVFELVRHWGRRDGAPAPQSTFELRDEFEVFPFWFSRESGDPELSYRALFPIYGTLKNKLWFERLSWTLFPLYVENEKRGAVTTSTPWPIVRITRGAAHGFGIWPLFQRVERPGVSRSAYYLWPLGFDLTRYPHPDDPAGTPLRRDVGVLPFYSRSTGPGYINEDYAWPFFGYTDRTVPARYHETRYFWPFALQGRGEQRYVNRWGPFFTHSIIKGYDKKWYAWPLLRQAKWEEEGLLRTKTQLLYFLYWSQRQQSIARPNVPAAELTHLWPLWSQWDNGAGREQWQLFSPLDVFFPSNEKVREAWSPLFAIARHHRQPTGETRTSLLWNAITWEERPAEASREFHLGPLLSVASQAEEKRIAIGNGLFGFNRTAGGSWRMFWLDFPNGNRRSAQEGTR